MANNSDFLSGEDYDLEIANGSFKVGAGDDQDADRIIKAHPGEFKQFPTVGVGISKFLNASTRKSDVLREIKKGLVGDNLKVLNLDITADFSTVNVIVKR